jgi:hypothetical protein
LSWTWHGLTMHMNAVHCICCCIILSALLKFEAFPNFATSAGFWCDNLSFGVEERRGWKERGPLLLFNPRWKQLMSKWREQRNHSLSPLLKISMQKGFLALSKYFYIDSTMSFRDRSIYLHILVLEPLICGAQVRVS